MLQVKWAKFNDWSGPCVRGSRPYKPQVVNPFASDVLLYAVAVPEGGAYDTFVAYDGTAVTAGLFQWTLTSGRLQRLLDDVLSAVPALFNTTVGMLFEALKLELIGDKLLKGGKLLDVAGLRDTFTPPGGKVPRSGANWERAKSSAIAFSTLFSDPRLDKVQIDFFLHELRGESTKTRPKLLGRSIASILYPNGWPDNNEATDKPIDACRALFWSCWQNAPRKAEEYLNTVATGPMYRTVETSPDEFTLRYARKIAHSTFGYWGIEKCAAVGRASRYSKIASSVNLLLGAGALPQNP